MITHYRHRILAKVETLLRPLPIADVLDFGSGDGFFASHVRQLPQVKRLAPVDVVERKESLVVPQLYDGRRLPFDDGAFDLAYAVDVLHHCPDPLHAIDDMARCSSRYLLIKDHTYHTAAGRWTLAVLDELGNRRFGIPSPYLYQQDWRWAEHLEARGWRRVAFEHPLACHTGLLAATNRLQWIALWERR
jgi:SAM-dependent methyltransferase